MEEPNGQSYPEETKICFESLYDTFVKYLNPEVIINNDSWIDAHKGCFVKHLSSRETAVQNLIGWIVEEDDCKTAVEHFIAALRNIPHESGTIHPAIIGGTDEEKLQMSQNIKNIILILDGSLKHLSLSGLDSVLDMMLNSKLISQVTCQQAKQIQNPYERCLKILTSIRKGKPDWPLVFFCASIRQNHGFLKLQESDTDTTHPMELAVSHMANAIASETDTSSRDMIFSNNTETKIGLAETDFGEHGFSEMSTNFSFFSSRHGKVYMSKEDVESPGMKMLLTSGNIDSAEITSDPNSETQNNRHVSNSTDYSDEEDTDDSSAVTDSEETPSLNLRKYQIELAENAIKGYNTIICAPTGSGKTRVATHIIRNHLEHKEANEERRVAFLARTVPLVMQQCKSLKKYLPKNFEVTSLTGDSEDSMHLHIILPHNDVIVMTPRILENHLKKGALKHLGQFSMLVFDECHHTRKGEPYNTLMYSYLNTKKQIRDAEEKGETSDIKLPQIVGLTASISVEKAVQDDEAVKYILKVCGNLDAVSISCVEENIAELKQTVPVPKEELKKLREVENDSAVSSIIKIMKKLEVDVAHHAAEIKTDEMNALLKKIPSDKKSQQYGQWTVKIKNVAKAFPRQENRETISSVRALMIIANYLSVYNIALELHDLVLMDHVLAYLDKSFVEFSQNNKRSSREDQYFQYFSGFKDRMKNRLRTENPNLTILRKNLCEHLIEKGGKSCGLIFVRTRAMTEALVSWLNTCDDIKLRELKATVFTGTGASVEDGGMTTAEQDEVLQRFKSGDVRLLVSTSVGEEGIDIPECNLVIKYNHVGNEVTTMQTRGRSRKEGGMSILLAMDKTFRKEIVNQEKSKMMERAIQIIRKMSRSKIRKMNKIHQLQIMKDEEIQQIIKQQEESNLLRSNFKMVCHLCRKVVIDSANIRTIFQTHHVVVESNILKQTKTVPYNKAMYIDECKMIGSVRCMGEPEEGKFCYNKLGTMMVYSKIPFVVLGIKNFGFDLNQPLKGLQFYNQWKKVPYFIDEIGPNDFKRYLPESKVVSAMDGESDDDDSSSDDDGDKGNKPHNKNVDEPDTSPSAEQAAEKISDNIASATEQKGLLEVDNMGGVNGTVPKRLDDVLDSQKDKDSGFPGTILAASDFSPRRAIRSNQLLGAGDNGTLKDYSNYDASGISSFQSNDKHHLTQPIPLSQAKRSQLRIENHNLIVGVTKILNNAPKFDPVLSIMAPLSSEKLPSLQCSEPSESIENSTEAGINSTDEDRTASKEVLPERSDSAAEGGINSTDEDRTAPKEVLPERRDSDPLQHGQSGQNNLNDENTSSRTQQVTGGLSLL